MAPYDVAVVGAGASGLMAALAAAGAGARVLLAEAGDKPGRKLLATGNGRCNLSNLHISPEKYHGDTALAAPFLAEWPARRIQVVFASLGLLIRADGEGRVYPHSLQAAAVVKVFLAACEQAGVTLRCAAPVEAVEKTGRGFALSIAGAGQVEARRVVLACGGSVPPGAGGGYRLARQLGHSVTKLSPSLVGLRVPAGLTRPMKGMRCKARAALCQGPRLLYAESGEVIFGDGSVSGICVMNLSARLRGLPPGRLRLCLDLAEAFAEEELAAYLVDLRARFPHRPANELFAGLLNLRVGQELAKSLGLGPGQPLQSLSLEVLGRAAGRVKAFSLPVEGLLGWQQAQCTAGGVPLGEVDLSTMASRRQRGLFLTGELLDLDGDCGGYNLHWAWATGLVAGQASAGKNHKREGRACGATCQ